MTQPTIVFFGPDGGRPDRAPLAKVFLRTLLYSTADRGHVLQSMYVVLRRHSDQQTFGIWVYGARDELVRGSGLFVSKEGVGCNHHFLLHDATSYEFLAGKYQIDVFAATVHESEHRCLWSMSIDVNESQATALANGRDGLYFDWDPTTLTYVPHIDSRPSPSAIANPFLRSLS